MPSVYFDGLNRWMSDRVYPSIALNALKNSVLYYVMGQAPSANITIGRDGLVLLNGTDAGHENNLLVNSCVVAADPANLSRLGAALGRIAAFGRRRGYPIDVLVVPTTPVLYGDRLPGSIPSDLRAACAAGYARKGPLSAVEAPAGMRFVYPFAELAALRDDPAMYPNGNYHAIGLSVRTATEAYLRAIGAPPVGVALARTTGFSEALESRGLHVPFPAYAAAYVEPDGEASSALSAVTAPYRDDPGQVVTVYRDPAAPDRDTLFVLSDSFGTNQALDLSAAFRVVAQMQTPHRDLAGMIDAVERSIRFDRMLLVFNDTNLVRLSEFGERLSSSAER